MGKGEKKQNKKSRPTCCFCLVICSNSSLVMGLLSPPPEVFGAVTPGTPPRPLPLLNKRGSPPCPDDDKDPLALARCKKKKNNTGKKTKRKVSEGRLGREKKENVRGFLLVRKRCEFFPVGFLRHLPAFCCCCCSHHLREENGKKEKKNDKETEKGRREGKKKCVRTLIKKIIVDVFFQHKRRNRVSRQSHL